MTFTNCFKKSISTKLLFVFFIFSLKTAAQCQYQNTTFKATEKASYEVYYNWGFIWLNAAEAKFDVQSTTFKNKPALHIKSSGQTYSNYDWIFKVRDYFECIIDAETVTPYYFSRLTNEGGYKVENNYTFNYKNNTILSNTWNNKSVKKSNTIHADTCTLDVLSAIYACRTIDFNLKSINDTIPLKMIIDGEIFKLFIRYLGKETIVNRDNRMFNCNKFSVMLVEGTIFSGGEDMFIWVTDDKNQIPVCIEAKILVGSVKAMLKEVQNTMWPANYQIYNLNE